MSLVGNVAISTGRGQSIDLAYALELAHRGASVAVVAQNSLCDAVRPKILVTQAFRLMRVS